MEVHFGGALVELALQTLATGPRHTKSLAETLLGARGNMRPAAAAIYSLLGCDPRFAVDASGVWSLAAPELPAAADSLLEEEWVVVDVETTGTSPNRGDRITEVAAVCVSGGKVTETFSSLVNPERSIPAMITSLTGITDEMVRGAPRFHEVAPRLEEALRGRVFVAHNASFDWRFVTSEFERSVGRRIAGRQLCTVRLARKLLPELPSRTLDALAVYFDLEIESRHRALDDAVATAEVLLRFCDLLEERGITDWEGVERFLSRRASRPRRSRMPRSMDSA